MHSLEAIASGVLGVAATLVMVAQEVIAQPEAVAWGGVAALPLVVGIVQVAKRAGLPARFAGVLALALGVGGGIFYGYAAGLDVAASVPQGILVGLAASGVWSTTKSAGLGK